MLRARVERDAPGAVAKRGARHVHGGIAHADDGHVLADLVGVGAHEVVEAKVHVAARLPGDAERLCAPGTRAHEHGIVSVTEEVLDEQGLADRRIGADLDAEVLESGAKAPYGRARQAKVGDAVAHDAAHLRALFEHGDVASGLAQHERGHNAGWAAADDGDLLAAGSGRLKSHAVEVRVGHIALDGPKLHGRPLASQHAGALALLAMVAHKRARKRERVVGEERSAGLFDATLAKKVNNLRDGRVHGARFLAARSLAAQATLRLFDDMQGHVGPLSPPQFLKADDRGRAPFPCAYPAHPGRRHPSFFRAKHPALWYHCPA